MWTENLSLYIQLFTRGFVAYFGITLGYKESKHNELRLASPPNY